MGSNVFTKLLIFINLLINRYQTYAHERNYNCRIREFIYREHRCVSLENEILRIVVAADKGSDIIEFLHKPTDTELMWQSANGLRAPAHFRPSAPLATGHFREYFAGGWYEMLPNGPAPCQHRGAEFGFHGEATLLPWNYRVELDEPECVAIKFEVRLNRLPLRVEKTLKLESQSATLRISERIVNETGQEVEFLWGHHPTFGYPFITEDCRIYVPPCRVEIAENVPVNNRLAPSQNAVWPTVLGANGETIDLSQMPAPEARSHDFARLEDFKDGWFAIVNEQQSLGFALRWDEKVFPIMGLWQIARGATDYPWYAMNYLLAIEPACDLPSLAEAARRGTALKLAAGEKLETALEATVFRQPQAIKKVEWNGVIK